MPQADAVLAQLERDGLRDLTGTAAIVYTFRAAGLEILVTALGKIYIPIVCAFTGDPRFEAYHRLHSSREVGAARAALGTARLSAPVEPRSVIRDRAIAAALAEGLGEGRAQLLVDRALATIESIVPTSS